MKLKNDVNPQVRIDLIISDDPRSEAFQSFCDGLHGLIPGLIIKTEKEKHLPCLKIDHVTYHMIPSGKELEFFLEFLIDRFNSPLDKESTVYPILRKIKIPAPVKIYVLPGCPHCPIVVSQILSLAAISTYIMPTIIDGSLFPELIQDDGVKSAPTLILDTQFQWSGEFEMEELVNAILNRDPSQLSTRSLKSMIEDGKADHLAKMMIEANRIFPAFQELLIHPKWSTRLGAMVVYEILAEEKNRFTSEMIPYLWKHFDGAEDQVKGDIIYLVGLTRGYKSIQKLKSIMKNESNNEVKEAAKDALRMIEGNPDCSYRTNSRNEVKLESTNRHRRDDK